MKSFQTSSVLATPLILSVNTKKKKHQEIQVAWRLSLEKFAYKLAFRRFNDGIIWYSKIKDHFLVAMTIFLCIVNKREL